MRFHVSTDTVELGDLIQYEDKFCMVIDLGTIYIKGLSGEQENKFPIGLLDLSTGKVVNAYKSLNAINKFYQVVAKNKHIELYY